MSIRPRRPRRPRRRSRSLEEWALEVILVEEYLRRMGGPEAERLMREVERAKREIYMIYMGRRPRRTGRGVAHAKR